MLESRSPAPKEAHSKTLSSIIAAFTVRSQHPAKALLFACPSVFFINVHVIPVLHLLTPVHSLGSPGGDKSHGQ